MNRSLIVRFMLFTAKIKYGDTHHPQKIKYRCTNHPAKPIFYHNNYEN